MPNQSRKAPVTPPGTRPHEVSCARRVSDSESCIYLPPFQVVLSSCVACLRCAVPWPVILSRPSTPNCPIPRHPERSEGSPREAHRPQADSAHGSEATALPSSGCALAALRTGIRNRRLSSNRAERPISAVRMTEEGTVKRRHTTELAQNDRVAGATVWRRRSNQHDMGWNRSTETLGWTTPRRANESRTYERTLLTSWNIHENMRSYTESGQRRGRKGTHRSTPPLRPRQ